MVDLDVSELEPPEPYTLAVECLASLPSDSILNMTHRQEPYPLYQTADEMGFLHQTTYASDGVIHIYFWHKANRDVANYFYRKALRD